MEINRNDSSCSLADMHEKMHVNQKCCHKLYVLSQNDPTTYFRKILRKVFSLEESSALSESAAVGGGVEMSGTDMVELAVDGAGDALPMVEPDEAYAAMPRRDKQASRGFVGRGCYRRGHTSAHIARKTTTACLEQNDKSASRHCW